HGYTIMPFGLVGPDDFYGHLMEGQDLPDSALGKLLAHIGLLNDNTRSDIVPPIPIGSLGTPLPKPQRCYLGFGEPINLSRHKGKALPKKTLLSVRAQVAQQIDTQLAELLLIREQDKGKDSLLRRLLTL
ncbi:MAG: acyltransferase, partial [Halioglobus sp.]